MTIYAAFYNDYRYQLNGEIGLSSTFGWTESYELAKLYLYSHYYWGKLDEAKPCIVEFTGDSLFDIQYEINHIMDFMTYSVDLSSGTEIYRVASIAGTVVTTNDNIMAIAGTGNHRADNYQQFYVPDKLLDVINFVYDMELIKNPISKGAFDRIKEMFDETDINKDIDKIIYGIQYGIFKKV